MNNLDRTIDRLIEAMSKVDPTSESYERMTESLSKLYRLKLESDKNESENRRKDAEMNFNMNMKSQTAHSDKVRQDVDRVIKVVEIAMNLVIPTMMYDAWTDKVLEFETTGTVTSTVGRGLFQKLNPFRTK